VTAFEAVRTPTGAVEFTMRFRNTGDLLIDPDVTFYIEDEDNNQVGRARPAAVPPFVQAGAEGIVSARWTEVLEPGEYAARVSLRYAPDRPPISRRTTFTVPKPAEAAPTPQAPEGAARE